jgi:hypothetical protein
MAEKNSVAEGQGKLLDAWEPSTVAGEPFGCIATTFTFSPAFFEEECLGRFLKLETDPAEDGPLYLIEREEKLAQIVCAAVIVDQHHCRGARSLRWDLHAARPKHGILHAKISLLLWSRLARIIIASANLTEDGYRRNREVYGIVDYHFGSTAPLRLLHEVVAFLRQNLVLSLASADSPSLSRANGLLDRLEIMARAWGIKQGKELREFFQVVPLLTGPGRTSLFEQIAVNWPGATPPDLAWILSPFYDPPEAKINAPAAALWDIMRKRGDVAVEYCLEAELTPEKGHFKVNAPSSLLTTRPPRAACLVKFSRLNSDTERPLHAKEIWLQDDRWVMLIIGSSNFTSAGTGIGKAANHEANLLYFLDKNHASRGYSSDLDKRFPSYEEIDDPAGSLTFQPMLGLNADAPGEGPVLPSGFLSATFCRIDDLRNEVILDLGDDLPSGWQIMDEEMISVLSEQDWRLAGCPKSYHLIWSKKAPSGLWVAWKSAGGKAWWPVNVSSSADLPAPDQLNNLSLDLLMEILTSARPLHEAIRRNLSRNGGGKGEVDLDPHKRVDTSGFLLQRTRRFSWALIGLRSRLERPAPTKESLDWRINVPVGVMAIAQALAREAKSKDELTFLLAELALELLRTRPQATHGSLSRIEVRSRLRDVAKELAVRFSVPQEHKYGSLSRYLKSVVKQIEED